MRIAYRCDVPIRITYSHTARKNPAGIRRFLYKKYMQYLIKKYSTHKLGCSSEAMPEVFGKNWKKQANCRVLYCSIETAKYKPDTEEISKKTWGFKDNDIIIGHIGDFREAKNHMFFLDVAKEIIGIRSEIKFYLVGADGGLQKQVERRIKELNLGRSVTIGGIRNDVPKLMKYLFDVLLFPSVYEGMPLVLVEAASTGLRTICSDVITPEATSVLPEAFVRLPLNDSPQKWANVVLDAIQKGRLERRYSYNIVKQSHFSAEYSIKQLMNIYDHDKRFATK
jgi:glycosyltransferase EpsF